MDISVACALFVLGAIMASFAGVIAERLNTGHSWVRGHSRCDACGRGLSGLDLVPIISWAVAGGRCRRCAARISVTSTLYEIALGTLFVLGYMHDGLTLSLAVLLASFVVLACIVRYDIRHTIVPPGLSAFLFLFSFAHLLIAAPDMQAVAIALMAAGAIGLSFALIHALSRGRAMGLGDAPVAFSLALLAAPDALSGLVYSFWIGGIVGIAILLSRPKGRRMGIEVPFVPFMAAGFLLAYFTGWTLFAPLPF